MRSLKFCAQILGGKEWIEFELLVHKVGIKIDYGVFYVDGVALNAKTLRQWTGLKDKKMIDVYEGDIGKFIVNGEEKIGYVGYYGGQWLVYMHSPIERHFFDGYILTDIFEGKYFPSTEGHPFEVIGNVYDDSELFTKEVKSNGERDEKKIKNL